MVRTLFIKLNQRLSNLNVSVKKISISCTYLCLEMFETAQKYIYEVMEQTLYKRFLFSEDGLNYIEGIVKKDIEERRKSRYMYYSWCTLTVNVVVNSS